MDSNAEFTIYSGNSGITVRTNVKTCYNPAYGLLANEEM